MIKTIVIENLKDLVKELSSSEDLKKYSRIEITMSDEEPYFEVKKR